MQGFVQNCRAQRSYKLQQTTLRRLVAVDELHARFLNSLARLEYVGVRKMLKVRRSETLDLEGLRHMLEEAVHATRLKKAAVALAGNEALVATFADAYTLAGDAAEAYFQAIDQEALRRTAQTTANNPEVCYLLTSAAIEVRAHTFYPVYQEVLRETASKVSVASIIADEQEHLQQMADRLPGALPDWRSALADVLRVEEAAFCDYLARVNEVVDAYERPPSVAAS